MAEESEFLLSNLNNSILTLTINRPSKKNAINEYLYNEIANRLNIAANDQQVRVVILTGCGDYYSSGNDLSSFLKADFTKTDLNSVTLIAKQRTQSFVQAFIRFPKPLIAAVNGPAIGIAVTTLALCDFVYASDKATFLTPFSSLGQVPEGCSSFTFPLLMGLGRANEVLLAGRKLNAQEALESKLVTRIFPHEQLNHNVQQLANDLVNLPPNTLIRAKSLIRSNSLRLLTGVNENELEILRDAISSPECMEAVMAFFSRKSKL
eukprot:TRINITY_DN945_c0_g3_i1.p1 TRINITY_DN945_c0_g3~~TRINITY_DN945_c0_g3_i1.p1  ORF type:complete len:264 (-),score=118.14 TRINITY_DN945_c0_g3_i1:87-878(-)